MIIENNLQFNLQTKNTSYVFHVLDTGHLEHLHYGRKIHLDVNALKEKHSMPPGCAVSYSQDELDLCLETMNQEVSTLGKGDIRRPFIELEYEDGNRTCDFVFDRFSIDQNKNELKTLPSSIGKCDHLCIVLKEKESEVYLELHYYKFDDVDVISKQVNLINKSNETIICHKLMSNQLDLQPDDYIFTTFTGAWAREMKKNEIVVSNGVFENGSICGFSSNHANPFVMISNPKTDEDYGSCFGMNLIYSGNHMETIEKGAYQKVRFLQGIHSTQFKVVLKPNECFEAPEAIMSYSHTGFNTLSRHFHQFTNENIVRGFWKQKERPILLNSWEAAYFDINEEKCVNLARKAKEVGIELFVMDDGWFSNRKDDTSSLGDWDVNLDKFPNGLQGLSKKIHDLDLLFGIWVEPEMVNVNSNLYKKHPEWTLQHPLRAHSEGRNQRLLDVSKKEVQDYIIESMTKVFMDSKCDYVKWDMNRFMSDLNNTSSHDYIVGFYSIMKELTKRFPKILFEGCASGGNRFDLGILCYYPQIWTSDDTDALERVEIQNNASYGYPLSIMGAHVSDVPNHQTGRITDMNTRFHVACFGNLGYEFNLLKCDETECKEIQSQIKFYKQHRKLFQYGTFYRIRSFKDGYAGTLEASLSNCMEWSITSKNKGMSFLFQKHVIPNTTYEKVSPKGLDEESIYHFYGFEEDAFVYGDTLMHHGLILQQGMIDQNNVNGRVFKDYATRLYTIEKKG